MALPIAAAITFPLLYVLLPAEYSASLSPLASTGFAGLMILGFACGGGFMLAELPNSFLKRQLDIAPGNVSSRPALRLIFSFFDRVDSTLGTLLFASLLIPLPSLTWLWAMLFGPGLHALFSTALYRVGVKERLL